MALLNPCYKRPKVVSFGGEEENVKRRRRREEEEEEEIKPRSRGMDLTLDMNSIMNHMDFVWDSRKVYEFQF